MNKKELIDKFIKHPSYFQNGAGRLSELFNVSREDIYWAKIVAREMINDEYPNKKDEIINEKPERNLLVISDLHQPYTHKDALSFIKRVRDENNITDVAFIGDALDEHYTSFHDHDIDGLGASREFEIAKKQLAEWHDEFPKALYCRGNHDILPQRKAFNAGLSKRWIKSIEDVYDLDGWEFADFHQIGEFILVHGIGQNALARSKDLGLSVISGHLHSKFEIKTWFDRPANKVRYGVYCGCLIDSHAYAFDYGKFNKPDIKGCVVVKDIEGENPSVNLIPLK